MKHLLIMRHAKANREDFQGTDFDRPLSDRGRNDAAEMGRRLMQKKFIPQLIVSSPAKRAIKTAKIVAAEIGYDEKTIDKETSIYEASTEDLLFVIRSLDDQVDNAAIFGHNPAFTALISMIGDKIIDHLPTAGQGLIKLDIQSWKQITRQSGHLVWMDYPKNTDH